MGVFQSFRDDGWNTYYPELHTAVWGDFSLVLITYFSVVIGVVLLIIVIGTRGPQKWLTMLRLLLCLHTGVVILVCIIGRCWQVSRASVISDYSIDMPDSIESEVGINVGLKEVNITLISNTYVAGRKFHIDYNEELALHHAGEAKNDFRRSLNRGLPWSIIYIMDYFQVDFGGLRWGRSIGEAGHFTSILLWSAFATWLMSNALLCIVVVRGLMFLSVTGCLMIIACVVYHCLQPYRPLIIHFEGGLIHLTYGWSFWLCFVTGIVTLAIGLAFLLLSWKLPSAVHEVYRVKKKKYINDVEDNSTPCATQIAEPLPLDTPITKRRRLYRQSNSTKGHTNIAFDMEDLSDDDHFSVWPVKNKNAIPMHESASCPDTIARVQHSDTCVTIVAEINESASSKSNSFVNEKSLACSTSSFGDSTCIKFLAPTDVGLSRDSLLEKSTIALSDIRHNKLSNHEHSVICETSVKDVRNSSTGTLTASYDSEGRSDRDYPTSDSTSFYCSKSNHCDEISDVIRNSEYLEDRARTRIQRHSSADIPVEGNLQQRLDKRQVPLYRSNSFPHHTSSYPVSHLYHGTHNISQGTHKISQGTHNISQGTHNTFQDTHNISQGTHNIFQGIHNPSQGTHNTSPSTQNTSQGTHNTFQGTHNNSEGTHNTSEGTHNTSQGIHNTSQGTHNISDSPMRYSTSLVSII